MVKCNFVHILWCVCLFVYFLFYNQVRVHTTMQWKRGLSLCLVQISAKLQTPIWLLLCDHYQC